MTFLLSYFYLLEALLTFFLQCIFTIFHVFSRDDNPGNDLPRRGSSLDQTKDSAVLPSRDADLLEPPSGLSGVKPPLHFGERLCGWAQVFSSWGEQGLLFIAAQGLLIAVASGTEHQLQARGFSGCSPQA